MSVSTYKFLHKIVAPQLTDVNFGQNLAEQFTNINMNFQRLASAAYLSGQQGNDVIIKRMDILYPELSDEVDPDTGERLPNRDENGNIIYSDVLTQFGADLVNCITGSDEFTDTDILIDIDYMIYQPYSDDKQAAIDKGFSFSESIKRNPYIDFFAIHDNDTLEDKLVCATQMYYFYDYRNGSLDLIDDVTEKMMDINTDDNTRNDFNDYTCFIICTYANDEFKFEKSTHMPTLYFDSSRGEFCWKFNGIDSNITAQGVKGDKGDSAKCWFCKGNAEVRGGIINCSITEVYTSYGSVNPKDIAEEFKVDDLCCVECYISNDRINSTYLDVIFGNVQYDSDSEKYYVSRDYDTSIMNMMVNSTPQLILYNALNKIDTSFDNSVMTDSLHGLFLPSSDRTYLHAVNVSPRGDLSASAANEEVFVHPVAPESIYGSVDKSTIGTKAIDPKPKIIYDGYNINVRNGEFSVTDEFGTYTITPEQIGKIVQNYEIKQYLDFNYGAYIPISTKQYYINGDALDKYKYIQFEKTDEDDDDYDLKMSIELSNKSISGKSVVYHFKYKYVKNMNMCPLKNIQLYIDILEKYLDLDSTNYVISKISDNHYSIKSDVLNDLNRSFLWPFGIIPKTIEYSTISKTYLVMYFCNTPKVLSSNLSKI